MNFRIVGIDDSRTTCDCCGKSNLKRTVALENAGEVVYYGVNCAARALGFDDKVYSARNADELVAKVNARETLRQKKAAMIAMAEDRAKSTGVVHVVTRKFVQGQVHFGYMCEQEYFARNKFGVSTVHRTVSHDQSATTQCANAC